MRIGIDLSPLAVRRQTGIPRYTQALVDLVLPQLPDSWEIFLFTDQPEAVIPVNHKNAEWCVVRPRRKRTMYKIYWYTVALPGAIRKLNLDVFHSSEPFVPRVRRVYQITTFHDLVPFLWPDTLKKQWAWYLKHELHHAAHASDRIITASQSTARDLIRVFGNSLRTEVTPIPMGVDAAVPVKYAAYPDKGLHQGQYVLAVGTIQPRKNYDAVLGVMEQLHMRGRHDIKLKIAGAYGWNMEHFRQRVSKSPLNQCVEVLGYVDDATLDRLYEDCRLYISLSINEGFGIPTLEAMARKTAVICSDLPAQNEYVTGVGRLVSLEDIQGIASSLEALWDDASERARLGALANGKATQYTWEAMAQQTLRVYLEAAGKIERGSRLPHAR